MAKNNCSEIERWIVIYANKARKTRKIRPFRSNYILKRIARRHSRKMAKRGKIWHGDGVARATSSSFISPYVGENVGLMYSGRVKGYRRKIKTNKDIALAAHLSWMKSSGHRRNILDPAFTHIGVGVKRRHNEFYLTQLFGVEVNKKMDESITIFAETSK